MTCQDIAKENLSCYLKKHKVLVFKLNASGGYINPIDSVTAPAKDLPCKPDFSKVFVSKLEPWKSFLSVYWNEELNNGNCFFQIDRLVPNTLPQEIYRNIGSAFVTKDTITMNYGDDAGAILSVKDNCIYYNENRFGNLLKTPYTYNSNNAKFSSIAERNKALGCQK